MGAGQTFEVSRELHQKPGGPIFTQFFPANFEHFVPGRLFKSANGEWQWRMELASVELLVPSDPDRKDSRLFETVQGLSCWKRYPYHLTGWDIEMFSSDSAGGWLAFRVPAGRYRFKVGEHYYAGEEGVAILPGRINRLEPVEAVVLEEEEQ